VGIVPKIFAAMSKLTSCDVFSKELRIVRKCFFGVKSLENDRGEIKPVKESSERLYAPHHDMSVPIPVSHNLCLGREYNRISWGRSGMTMVETRVQAQAVPETVSMSYHDLLFDNVFCRQLKQIPNRQIMR